MFRCSENDLEGDIIPEVHKIFFPLLFHKSCFIIINSAISQILYLLKDLHGLWLDNANVIINYEKSKKMI